MYKPTYKITPYLLNLIDEISSLRAWIERATIKVSWLPTLQKEAHSKTAHSSTAIEGNPLSLHQVKAIARGDKVGAHIDHEREVTNYLKAIKWLKKNMSERITENKLLALHQVLSAGLLPEEKSGKYKQKQNYVLNERKIKIYTPPSSKASPQLVKELLIWLSTKEAKDLHPVLVCAVVHHRLVSIHPFSDGNGRLSRALGTWILYQRGFDTQHIFSLDEFFASNRKMYYLKLQQARDLDDNLTHWIEHVAEGILHTLKDVKKRIEDLHVSSKSCINLTPRQEDLLRILRDHPHMRVAGLQKELKLTRARINQLIMPLVDCGLVIKEGRSKATHYRLA
ncbi:hypothetical protein A2291_07045 [candidate division WOR-1 bacterium RIFOXYB2_FULL_42_35]|uniref:Fido domain-containing protein n=1 Tax=candidate division WOR-1 bacterium RIFOXYC2_FULL_41_25 TaxID=1802586 RepID=A0A1F4TKF1_UNCSA|nr:MAG: hypothetical protein A2247_04385 [candidate division WOR-1 bacterium RIFOXYA2_FULL_41_14]OGC22464.1 MAG: hypothetical protein A2291_07045 [candidate division WOR-1 bacterium RIFOXYB2_FULL_42_35]OGC33202.1 MAG: hypothetical protein A2462_07220 [candidate division WOR-1 bacterium RIFOXYC2_FULL_41_25]OGC41916.1 MAG: hypothetical protein A2548_03855 [candidate division WOR-1 bacterium RIFOXYD2_FULL_41_8]